MKRHEEHHAHNQLKPTILKRTERLIGKIERASAPCPTEDSPDSVETLRVRLERIVDEWWDDLAKELTDDQPRAEREARIVHMWCHREKIEKACEDYDASWSKLLSRCDRCETWEEDFAAASAPHYESDLRMASPR